MSSAAPRSQPRAIIDVQEEELGMAPTRYPEVRRSPKKQKAPPEGEAKCLKRLASCIAIADIGCENTARHSVDELYTPVPMHPLGSRVMIEALRRGDHQNESQRRQIPRTIRGVQPSARMLAAPPRVRHCAAVECWHNSCVAVPKQGRLRSRIDCLCRCPKEA